MFLAWDQPNIHQIAKNLLSGEVVFMPSDTIYGVLGIASDPTVVEEIYRLKGRKPDKPAIVLISQLSQLKSLKVIPDQAQLEFINKYWPGPVSIVLPCPYPELSYLHRGTKSLAFRLPNQELLKSLLDLTGPLVAPSANPEGASPAKNTQEGYRYFADEINLYVDGGELSGQHSTLVSLLGSSPQVLRGQL